MVCEAKSLTLLGGGPQVLVCAKNRRRLCSGCGHCKTDESRGTRPGAAKPTGWADSEFRAAMFNTRTGQAVEAKRLADEPLRPGAERICQSCRERNETASGPPTCRHAVGDRGIAPRLGRDESGKQSCSHLNLGGGKTNYAFA